MKYVQPRAAAVVESALEDQNVKMFLTIDITMMHSTRDGEGEFQRTPFRSSPEIQRDICEFDDVYTDAISQIDKRIDFCEMGSGWQIADTTDVILHVHKFDDI